MLRTVALFLASSRLLCADPSADRAPVEPRDLPAPDQAVAETKPVVKELDAERLQIGEVILNRKTREIRFPAAVNMAGNELLEFAIVHSRGKIHESLLVTDVSATHLNLAFKLLRYQASAELYPLLDEDGSVSSRFPEVSEEVKAASRIDLRVEWEEDGKERSAKLREWISHGSTGQAMAADPWVYGGSGFYEGRFMAESSGDFAAIFLSNVALINYSGDDNDSDEVWLPFPKRVPPVGTKVTVVIAPLFNPNRETMKSALCLAFASTLALAPAQDANPYLSLQLEMKQAIARGNAWLAKQQKEDGRWDTADLPAFTALALTAAVRDPQVDPHAELPDHVAKGYEWLIAQQKEDGGIYNKGLSVYNTATAVTALTAAGREIFEPAIVKGRKHLIGEQWDAGEPGETDHHNDGGIGYGSDKDRADLSNTYLAIEALALSKKVIEDGKHGQQPELDWDAAVTFLSRCQNLGETNDMNHTAESDQNRGGFTYSPTTSKAGEDKLPDGRTALRSYGSISYAGLLSLIYAKLGPDDPRVQAVKEWLGKNYTLSENPGMGAEGLYYYYQAMSKALSAANINKLELENGKQADWRKDLAGVLLSKQREDGSWVNDNGRWMESNPVLVTAYTVMALEQIYYSVPGEP